MNPARRLFLQKTGPFFVWQWMVLAMAVGIPLRLGVVFTYSLFVDDASTYYATAMSWGGLLENRFRMGHLPLFFLLFKAWTTIVGTSSIAGRIPSFIFSTLAIPLSGVLAARIGGARAAAIAMCLAAVHPSIVRHSSEMRMYSWLLLLGPLLLIALARMADKPTPTRVLAAAGVHFVMLSLHASSPFFSLAAFGTFAVIALRKHWPARWWGALAVAFLLPYALVLPQLVYLKMHLDMHQYQKFLDVSPIEGVMDALYQQICGMGSNASWIVMPQAVVLLLGAAAALIFTQPDTHSPDYPNALSWKENAALCLAAGVGMQLIAFVVSLLGPQVLGDPRYYIATTIPLIAIIAAAGAAVRLRNGLGIAALSVAFLYAGGVATDRAYGRLRRTYLERGIGMNVLVQDLVTQLPGGAQVVRIDGDDGQIALAAYYLGNDTRFPIVAFDMALPKEELRQQLRTRLDPAKDIIYIYYRDFEQPLYDAIRDAYPERTEVSAARRTTSYYILFKASETPAH
ncbi:hypothetical protein BH09SUM1_BH09SUM1_22670 [soil metagenome]